MGALAVGIAIIALSFQIWHFQIIRSIALYEDYESSEAVKIIDSIAMNSLFRLASDKKNPYSNLVYLAKQFHNRPDDIRFFVSVFLSKVETLHDCIFDEIFNKCDPETAMSIFHDSVNSAAFALTPYIYCDEVILNTFGKRSLDDKISDMEVIVKAFMEYEEREKIAHDLGWTVLSDYNRMKYIFRTRKDYDEAIQAGRISPCDDYAIIEARFNRPLCRCYRNLLNRWGNHPCDVPSHTTIIFSFPNVEKSPRRVCYPNLFNFVLF